MFLIPGFLSNAMSMRPLGEALERCGHRVSDWGQGWNFGVCPNQYDGLCNDLVAHVEACGGEPVILIGWSLGGLYAREAAKRHPEHVRAVITMATPFSGDPRNNNAWRLYEWVAGHPVDAPPVEAQPHVKPPVPTIAIWSPNDGVIAPSSARGRPGERDRSVRVHCGHLSFCSHGPTIETVLDAVEALSQETARTAKHKVSG